MKFEIEFNKDKTVATIKASFAHLRQRPDDPALRKHAKRSTILEEFKKRHPDIEVLDMTGAEKIYNFKALDESFGEWTLNLASSRPVTAVPKKKTTKYKTTAAPRTAKTKTGA